MLRLGSWFASSAEKRTFTRYVIIGLTQNAAFYGLNLLLLAIGLRAWQATAITYPVATLASFAANRSWSFGGRARDRAALVKYVLVYLLIYPAAIALTAVQEFLGFPGWLATLNTMAAIVIPLYLILKYWVFQPPEDSPTRRAGFKGAADAGRVHSTTRT